MTKNKRPITEVYNPEAGKAETYVKLRDGMQRTLADLTATGIFEEGPQQPQRPMITEQMPLPNDPFLTETLPQPDMSNRQMLNENIPMDGVNIQSHGFNEDRMVPQQRQGYRSLNEVFQGGYVAKDVLKQGKGGRMTTRYTVADSQGQAVNGLPLFRHMEAAAQCASFLSETNGKTNDPRVLNMIKLHEQESELIREKKLFKSQGRKPPRELILEHDNVKLRMGVRS